MHHNIAELDEYHQAFVILINQFADISVMLNT